MNLILVDLSGEVADIDFVISTSWYDSRLKNIEKVHYNNIVSVDPKNIWTPDIFIGNQVLDAGYVLFNAWISQF